MSKRSNIKWRDKDVKELQRVVKNFNAKISRVAKKNPMIAEYLPEKLSVKALRDEITNRQDFNNTINSVKRFSRKGSEEIITTPKGLTMTKYEVNEVKHMVRVTNIKRANERKANNISRANGTMGTTAGENLRPKHFSLNKTKKEWEKFKESLKKETGATFKEILVAKYREKYLQAIQDFLGDDGNELYNYVKNLDANTIQRNSLSIPILHIGFLSDPLPTKTIATSTLKQWKALTGGVEQDETEESEKVNEE